MKIKSLLYTGLAVVVLAAVTACAMAPGPGTASNRNRVGSEELAATNSPTVYEALEMVRPGWLTARGSVSAGGPDATANVYMYGNHVGDLDYLREVYVIDVTELRFWPAGEAGARFGMGNPRGVIEIIPR